MSNQEAIIAAVKAKDAATVAALLQQDPSLAAMRTAAGALVLTAIYAGAHDVAHLLLQHNPPLDVFEAATAGQVARLTELLDQNPALVTAANGDGFMPLHLAAFFGQIAALRLLVQRGADVNAIMQSKVPYVPSNTALHAAIAGGPHREAARELIAAGANPNLFDSNQHTPLHTAAFNDDVELIALLLQHGANVNARMADGPTPLAYAIKNGKQAAEQALQAAGGSTGEAQVAALSQELINEFVTHAHGNLAKVQELLEEHHALLQARAVWDEDAMGAASHTASREILTYLLDFGAPMDIFAAIILGQRAQVKAYLDAKPELAQARGAHGIPVLFYPVIVGDQELTQLLLERGADVNAGAGGNTALHGAAWFNQPSMAAWLLAQGAQVDALDYQGKTPLAIAVEQGHAAVADVLRQPSM